MQLWQSKSVRIITWLVSTLLILFLLASVVVSLFVDINHYKEDISAFVKEQSGLELRIKGPMKLGLLNGLKLNVSDIDLLNNTQTIIDIESLNLGLSLTSMLFSEPEITSVSIRARLLNLSRDRMGVYNFSQPQSEQPQKQTVSSSNDRLAIERLFIHDIELSIQQLNYVDDLNAFKFNLTDAHARLSQLPVIDQQQLVIDDPRVLVSYIYDGNLVVKKLLFNQFQLSDLVLNFNAQQGHFSSDRLSFGLIQEGQKHDLPALVIDTRGQLQLRLAYELSEAQTEPLWAQPDIIKVSHFDFDVTELSWRHNGYQLETRKAHFLLDNLAIVEDKKFQLDNLLIESLFVKSGQIHFLNKEKQKYTFRDTELEIQKVPVFVKGKLINTKSEHFLRLFAKQAKVRFNSAAFANEKYQLEKIRLQLAGNGQRIELKPFSFKAMESEVIGHGFMHFEKDVPQWNYEFHSEHLNIEPISGLMDPNLKVQGIGSVHHQVSGVVEKSDFKFVQGEINFKADDIVITGINLDKILEDFQNSQSVGLLDVGAVALLGPAGMLVSKGNDYHKLTKSLSARGSSKVRQINSHISFDNDMAIMKDVAFATSRHRLAVQGKINLDKRQFKNFEVATIDKQGCPIYKEQVMGTIDSPKVKKVNVVMSGLINPVNSLISKFKKSLDIDCEKVFYSGVVKSR